MIATGQIVLFFINVINQLYFFLTIPSLKRNLFSYCDSYEDILSRFIFSHDQTEHRRFS